MHIHIFYTHLNAEFRLKSWCIPQVNTLWHSGQIESLWEHYQGSQSLELMRGILYHPWLFVPAIWRLCVCSAQQANGQVTSSPQLRPPAGQLQRSRSWKCQSHWGQRWVERSGRWCPQQPAGTLFCQQNRKAGQWTSWMEQWSTINSPLLYCVGYVGSFCLLTPEGQQCIYYSR